MKNKTGGKGHKKHKNSKNTSNNDIQDKKETILADYKNYQDYAIILKRLGNGIMLLQLPYENGVKPETKQILGVVRGGIKRKFIFTAGDVVLFSYRMGLSYNINDKEKVDILHKYESRDKNQIIKKDNREEIKNLLKEKSSYCKDEQEDSFFFEDEGESDCDFDDGNNFTKKIEAQPERNYDYNYDSESESSCDDNKNDIDIDNI